MNKYFASALLVAYATAANQVPVKKPVEPVAPVEPVEPSDPVDEMWTDDKIKDFVSDNFGGVEWDAFHEQNLVSDDARETFAENLATKLVAAWVEENKYLPHVCEAGVQCRNEVSRQLIADLLIKWSDMLD